MSASPPPPPPGPWIDTHCHLDRFARNGTLDAVLNRAWAGGIEAIVTIGTNPGDWEHYARLVAEHSERIAWTAGLHPCDVDEHWEEAVAGLRAWWDRTPRPVGLGEIGLDSFHLPKDPDAAAVVFARQEAAFQAQLGIARTVDGPVVIHSRGAFARTVEMIDASGLDWSRVVYHCFVEGPDEMDQLRRRGGRGSFTGILTYSNAATIRLAAARQGLDAAMVETDAPYLAPVPLRGQTNEPSYVAHTGARLAEVLGLPVAEVAATTTATARRFFGLR